MQIRLDSNLLRDLLYVTLSDEELVCYSGDLSTGIMFTLIDRSSFLLPSLK